MQERKVIQNSKSWKDLNETLSMLSKSKQPKLAGDIFEHLTKLYLQTAPQYKSKLRKVYLEKEVPSNLRKKLNLPDSDEGIDLIAETNDKEYWAIQCKYRSDSNETLTVKEDLSTFNNLAFTHCKNITHGIVCATVNKPPKKIKLLKSIGFELLETWLGLDDGNLFTQIKAKCVGKKYKPIILKPRTHQVTAIKKTVDHFKSNERGKIIMPCGTGKSLTAFWIAKKMGVKSILVAVPSLSLLQQTLKVWTREFLINGIEPEWFCVCSDGTVKDEQDDYVTDTSDLGIKVDTNPKLIKQFLKKKTSKIKVLFTTYQSGRATAKGSRGFTYDLGIMDEAHKTVGSKTKEMAHLLHQKNVRIKNRIFMTATERLFRGDSDEFMSMDDPRDYGDLIYELSFKEAINSKPPIISDYKIITFGITVPEIEEIYNSNKYLEVKKVLKDITARELATALALRKAIKKFKINNAISFHRSIKRADNFRTQQDLITKIYPEYRKLKSFHVRGKMPTSDRATQMREFAKGKGLMTNARCLTEGVDLPAIDCVCFTDPKRSKVDIVQAAGRALRLSKGKKFGYILIPIFIPAGADFIEAAEEQGFDDVAITVRALAVTDTRITEYLRAISEGKKPIGGSPVEGITSANSLYKIEAEEFDKAIKLKVWDKVSYRNWMSYEQAKKYVQELKINSNTEFYEFAKSNKKPRTIPSAPSQVYKTEWKGWSDFLNTGRVYNIDYPKFSELRNYIRLKKIKTAKEYVKLWREGKLKNNYFHITAKPDVRYKNKGWISWPDFLGSTTNISYINREFYSLEKFKKVCLRLNIKNSKDFRKYLINTPLNKRDRKIPSVPDMYYKQWTSWPEVFGLSTGLRGNFVSFNEARKFARSLNFVNEKQWLDFVKTNKKPLKIPAQPQSIYKKDYKGIRDFLGYERSFRKKYFSFNKTKQIVQKLKFNSAADYIKRYSKIKEISKNLPGRPDNTFRNEWKGWPDFLGTNKEKKVILDKKEDWDRFIKENELPKDFPRDPRNAYKKKGFSWGDFLGSGRIASHRRNTASYKEAKKFAVKLNLKLKSDWDRYVKQNKLPINIPKTPQNVYRDKKFTWGDFLGTGRVANRDKIYKPYKEAKKFALSLKLKTFEEWKKVKLPNDIPRNFGQTYKDEFEGWATVLGNGNEKVDFPKYKDAKKLIKKMNIKSQNEYKKWWRTTESKFNLPGDASKLYKRRGDWISWHDFLGKK